MKKFLLSLVVLTLIMASSLSARSRRYYNYYDNHWKMEMLYYNAEWADEGAASINALEVRFGKGDGLFYYTHVGLLDIPGLDWHVGVGYDWMFMKYTVANGTLNMGVSCHGGPAFGYVWGGIDTGFFNYFRIGAGWKMRYNLSRDFGIVWYPLDVMFNFFEYVNGNRAVFDMLVGSHFGFYLSF